MDKITTPSSPTILGGNEAEIRKALARFEAIPVDWDLSSEPPAPKRAQQRTIAQAVSLAGPGTFLGKAQRRITLKPTELEGWWFNRSDLSESLPVGVSIHNVWTTGDIVSNIVLRSGSPHNYIRMVEHIIALRLGLDVDNLIIEMDSGDPPLFDSGSLDLVNALHEAGRVDVDQPVSYVTVKEPVMIGGPGGSFLMIHPALPGETALTLDCAVHFKTAIGLQRIQFPLNQDLFQYGSEARTNTSVAKMFYCRTIGKLFADIRNLGYNRNNVLIAGRWGYYNQPRLIHNHKSLEAVWHRAVLDLVAALALIEKGRLAGHVTSYKAGHRLDVELVQKLYKHDLIVPVPGVSD
jgi:UDP-3-O-acyl-N-acetylglucosamine deacetylase